jgi:hypothetical protein
MELKQYIAESFSKEYAYRVKIAADCGSEHMDIIEKCLAKYNFVSASAFKRQPIQENPVEFQRAKGACFTSEVCSSDVILKYPINERILEVWLAVNLGLDHERVLCYGVDEPRREEADLQAERLENDKDRQVSEEDAVLNNEDQAHYEAQNQDLDLNFGEEYNKKFLDELNKIKNEKGADYFRNYPSKDELMGDNLRPVYDTLVNSPNMGRGNEQTKEVDVISQSGSRSR